MNYRIYLKNLERYANDNEEYLISPDGDKVYFREINLEIGAEKLTRIDSSLYKLEKFSGSYDIDNVPIYTGDIIKYISFDDWFDKDGHETYGIIHFDFRTLSFVIWRDIFLDRKYVGTDLKHFVSKCKVIGNVNQNKEILKEYFKI